VAIFYASRSELVVDPQPDFLISSPCREPTPSPTSPQLGPARYLVRVSEEPLDHENDAAHEADEIELLRSTPIETIVGNHVFHLLQLAAVHLAATPPNLPAAQLTIDVVSAMVKAGGERLGEHAELYRNAIAEVQQVYVRAATKSDA
jgi:hypothetical protein